MAEVTVISSDLSHKRQLQHFSKLNLIRFQEPQKSLRRFLPIQLIVMFVLAELLDLELYLFTLGKR